MVRKSVCPKEARAQ